jgi:predicted nuclease of restriction endonuclease-like RecB superfamily
MANKYGAKKIEIDGHVFDSKREAEFYQIYKLLLDGGQLTSLELQPQFELQPHFRDSEGKMERAIKYTPDFLLTYPDGKKLAVEVKGFRTRDYILRRKLFR